jgi:hypothetical protein
MINIDKLMEELSSAGILISGCNTNGIVWDVDGITEIQDRPDVASIISAHNPDTPSWGSIIAEKNRLLSASDWTQTLDAPFSDEQKQLWAAYRQLLRDTTKRFSNPEDVTFPKSPGG